MGQETIFLRGPCPLQYASCVSDLHAGLAGIMGCPHKDTAPVVWALHASHQSEADSAFDGIFMQTVGSFTWLLCFLIVSPDQVHLICLQGSLISFLSARDIFPSHSAFPPARVQASRQCLTSAKHVTLVPIHWKTAQHSCPRVLCSWEQK
jgi:hypothetical protein